MRMAGSDKDGGCKRCSYYLLIKKKKNVPIVEIVFGGVGKRGGVMLALMRLTGISERRLFHLKRLRGIVQ